MNKIILPLSYSFCWGVGVTLTKIALTEIPATTLLVIQLLSSVAFLAIACYLKTRQLPFSWRHWHRGLAGIFEPALAYMIGIFGVDMTTASNATLIGSTEVILTILLAAVFLGERLTQWKLILAGISFVGVLLLMLENSSNTGQTSFVGNGLVLLGTLFAVFYVLLSKKQIATDEPLQLTSSQQFVGLITTLFCFGVLSLLNSHYEVQATGISPQFWLLAIASGVMQYALAFLLYLTALQYVPVSQAAFYVALIPVFGVISAVVLIGEQPSVAQWIGGLLVIGSSYCASRLQPIPS